MNRLSQIVRQYQQTEKSKKKIKADTFINQINLFPIFYNLPTIRFRTTKKCQKNKKQKLQKLSVKSS